ncbi:unnamed protein product [Amoebophrya sp. A25]|nr:unnamed protein product [Amoebophrya sp. A25]|eukprot:GSA25T00005075001.1
MKRVKLMFDDDVALEVARSFSSLGEQTQKNIAVATMDKETRKTLQTKIDEALENSSERQKWLAAEDAATGEEIRLAKAELESNLATLRELAAADAKAKGPNRNLDQQDAALPVRTEVQLNALKQELLRVFDFFPLPGKVHGIISECIGTCLVNERMFESYLRARDRFLAVGGSLAPSTSRICVAPYAQEAIYDEIQAESTWWTEVCDHRTHTSTTSSTSASGALQDHSFQPGSGPMTGPAPSVFPYGLDLRCVSKMHLDEALSTPICDIFSPESVLLAGSASSSSNCSSADARGSTSCVLNNMSSSGVPQGDAPTGAPMRDLNISEKHFDWYIEEEDDLECIKIPFEFFGAPRPRIDAERTRVIIDTTNINISTKQQQSSALGPSGSVVTRTTSTGDKIPMDQLACPQGASSPNGSQLVSSATGPAQEDVATSANGVKAVNAGQGGSSRTASFAREPRSRGLTKTSACQFNNTFGDIGKTNVAQDTTSGGLKEHNATDDKKEVDQHGAPEPSVKATSTEIVTSSLIIEGGDTTAEQVGPSSCPFGDDFNEDDFEIIYPEEFLDQTHNLPMDMEEGFCSAALNAVEAVPSVPEQQALATVSKVGEVEVAGAPSVASSPLGSPVIVENVAVEASALASQSQYDEDFPLTKREAPAEVVSKLAVPREDVTTIHGLLLWFDCGFENHAPDVEVKTASSAPSGSSVNASVAHSNDLELSTSPWNVPTHWRQMLFPFADPLRLRGNERAFGRVKLEITDTMSYMAVVDVQVEDYLDLQGSKLLDGEKKLLYTKRFGPFDIAHPDYTLMDRVRARAATAAAPPV